MNIKKKMNKLIITMLAVIMMMSQLSGFSVYAEVVNETTPGVKTTEEPQPTVEPTITPDVSASPEVTATPDIQETLSPSPTDDSLEEGIEVPVETKEESTWYSEDLMSLTINNQEEFNEFYSHAKAGNDFSGKTILLNTDIDLSSTEQISIPSFKGTWDGQGFAVTNLTMAFFNQLDGATIKNTVFDGTLASGAKMTRVENCGFYIAMINPENEVAVILSSEETLFDGSFVLANIEAKRAAGFILEGSGTIENSYVSGYLQGEEVYGFSKEATVNNSYNVASLKGETRILFTTKEQTDNFYDARINAFSDEKATAILGEEMSSGNLGRDKFKETAGNYPEVKGSDIFHEQAREISKLSVLILKTDSNLQAMETFVQINQEEEVEWKINDIVTNDSEILVGEEVTLTASSNQRIRRYAMQPAERSITGPIAGEATTQENTQITYPTEIGKYYIVVEGESAPEKPADHFAAIEAGWKIIYWTGVERATELKWDTVYSVYSFDGQNIALVGSKIRTNKQLIDANITLTNEYELGKEIIATFNGFDSKAKGTLYFEMSETIDGNYTELSKIENFIPSESSSQSYIPTDSMYYNYLRVRFEMDSTSSLKGTFSSTTSHTLARQLDNTNVKITNVNPAVSGVYSITDKLSAKIDIDGKEMDVTYAWYQEGEVNAIATGTNYTVRESDIGKKLYVIATAKTNSDLKGSATSELTSEVEAIIYSKPDKAPVLISKDDTMFTIKADESEGLYQFRISDGINTIEYPTIARAGINTVIMTTNTFSITANTEYTVSVKRVGEYGYKDSEYGDNKLIVKTAEKTVVGDIKISGKPIFGEKLTASVMTQDINQTGNYVWNRLLSDGSKVLLISASDNSYEITKEDVGNIIEVSYQGSGSYAGEITTTTDRIMKASTQAPVNSIAVSTKTDTTVSVKLPSGLGKYIIGYSKTQEGVPTEYKSNGSVVEYALDNSDVTLEGFDRDSTYYLFVRLAETETHQKSPWIESTQAVRFETDKTNLSGSIKFEYETGENPMPGQRITARLDNSNTLKGKWEWNQIKDGVKSPITNFALQKDKQATYYVIPAIDTVGISYSVTFTADSGFVGKTEGSSKAVVDFALSKYNAPSSTSIDVLANSDTTLSATIKGLDGQYQFRYKKSAETIYTEVNSIVYADVEIIINGLDRNTKYDVQAKRVSDAKGTESDWSQVVVGTTEKTSIAGHVVLEGENRNGGILEATYQSASYTPAGSDTGGIWVWYRDDVIISGVTSNQYQLTKDDVGKVVSVSYTMPSNSSFKDSVKASTSVIAKAFSTNPTIRSISGNTQDSSDSHMIVKVDIGRFASGQDFYYIIQKSNEAIPDTHSLANWTKATTTTFNIDKDRYKEEFIAKEKYTLYGVNAESNSTLQSEMVSKEVTISDHTQTGTINFTGRTHVSKEYTATLTNGNNDQGTWKWYYSSTDYTNTNPSSWIEIESGFYPKTNSKTSVLSVTDAMKGRYLKAEFIADETKGFIGTIKSSKSATTVTKTYTEKLIIEGDPYEGSIITVKLVDSDRNLSSIVSNDCGVQLNLGNSYQNFIAKNSINETEMKIKISDITLSKKGYAIRGYVRVPDRKIYTTEDGKDIGINHLFSEPLNDEGFVYGTPIKNSTDLLNFMLGQGNYTNRSGYYVLTSNINMSGLSSVGPQSFSGTFDGDYHTISGLNNPLFNKLSSFSVVKNLVFQNSNVRSTGGNASVIANSSDAGSGTVLIERVLAVDSYVEGYGDVGFLIGKAWKSQGDGTLIKETMTAGGHSISTKSGTAVGGVFGWASGKFSIENLSQISTTVKISSNQFGYMGGVAGGTDNPAKMKNVYVASKIDNTYGGAKKGPVLGALSSYSENSFQNIYYDKIIGTGYTSNELTLGSPQAKDTKQMTGTALASQFGDVWTYKTGFYPRLTWILENASKNSPAAVNIANLYAATRGAFISLDGNTTETNLYNGDIYGTIQVPSEFLASNFTVKSLNTGILNVSPTGVITPLKAGTADIEVSYKDPSNSSVIKNTFRFQSKVAMVAYSSVNISGTTNIGNTLTATVLPSAAESETSYQWYRKSKDEVGNGTLIAGATKSTYKMTASDAGKQLRVVISKPGYGSMASSWSATANVVAPNAAPIINNATDGGALFTGQGGFGTDYEYAYATSLNGEKTIVTQKGASVTANGLSRNKTYYGFSRMAEGSGYAASAWSPGISFKTTQSEIVGPVRMDSSFNNGTALKMAINNTNEQTGTWKVERIKADTEEVIALIENTATGDNHEYTLKNEDVGYRIRVSYVGNGDFKSSQSKTSEVIKKAISSAPSPISATATSDSSITMNLASGTFDIGYRKTDDKTILVKESGVTAQTYALEGLERNTSYNLYVRNSENATHEASPWSSAFSVTTLKTNVSGSIAISGDLKTKGILTFTVPDTNSQQGVWKLERVTAQGNTTISPSSTTVDSTTRTMTYVIRDVDATTKLKAKFTGINSYQGAIEITTNEIAKEKLSISDMPSDIEVVGKSDNSLLVKANNGIEQYQFGYAKQGETIVTPFDVVTASGSTVVISGLERYTNYDIYIRKAAKMGYEPSDFVKVLTEVTDQTELNGHVSYTVKDSSDNPTSPTVGIARIGYTYTASYSKGSYIPEVDDSLSGSWQWYMDGEEITGETSASYTVPAMVGSPEISVRYKAETTSPFKGYQELIIGTLTKEIQITPNLPSVVALSEDNEVNSKLKITTNEATEGVYWYVQDIQKESIPSLISSSEAESNSISEDQWFKAETELEITVKPNTEYIVYAAKLENDSMAASSIISQRPVLSAKDELDKINANLIEADTTTRWKVLQNKEIRVDCQSIPTTGTWKYYVSNDNSVGGPSEDSWKIINNEVQFGLNEGKTTTYAYTSFQVPMKYLGYYLRVVYEGRDNYANSISYQSSTVLEGTLLKGIATVTAGNDVTVNQAIEVLYTPGKDDENNGYWRWYRETAPGTNQFEMILTDINTPYGANAFTDKYTPQSRDVGLKIYAEYNAADSGIFTGTARTATLSSTSRAMQNKPNNLSLKQVNGTKIQMNLPTNYVSTGATTPEVTLGYKLKNGSEEIKWLAPNEDWIDDSLKANTDYLIYARFERTSEYLQSDVSDAIEVKTSNESFAKDSLTITADSYESGKTLKATFSGNGFDQGYFKILRSDGTVVKDNLVGEIVNPVNSIQYTFESGDIGANIIVQYVAFDDAEKFGGTIEKSTRVITKPTNPESSVSHSLSIVEFKETELKATLSNKYEYVLNNTAGTVSSNGDWKKLVDTNEEDYVFSQLDPNKDYYLHARLAETEDFKQGTQAHSGKVNTWKRGTYIITYEGVTNAINTNQTSYTELTETFKLSDPIKKGHTFIGWTYDSVVTPTKNVTISKYSSGNKTFVANWRTNQYKVIFDSNNNSAVSEITLDYNSLIAVPNKPIKSGNDFVGWYQDPTLTLPWNFETDRIGDSDLYLYGKWEPGTFTATFYGQGGTSPNSVEGIYGTKWPNVDDSIRQGYEFLGWYNSIVGGDKLDSNLVVPANNVEFYARWKPIEYMIEYVLDSGENDVNNPLTYTIESSNIVLADAKRNGFEFLGWTSSTNTTPIKNLTISKGSMGDKIYTANFKYIQYKINYELDGGTNNSLNPSTYTIDTNTFTLIAPRKVGYSFKGWIWEGETTPQNVTITKGSYEDKNYKAVWERADAKVYFETNGGSVIAPIEVKQGEIIYSPPVPTKIGYKFDGWYCEDNFSNLWNFDNDKMPNNDSMTLYAKWIEKEYTISFNGNGGSEVGSINKKYNEQWGTLPQSIRSYYDFLGWFTQVTGGLEITSTSIVGDGNLTVYAHWQPTEYTITYLLNGGENNLLNPATYTVESGDIILKEPYKEDYVFKGWTWSGQINAEKNVTIRNGSNGNLEYTANWDTADYKVDFDSQGGSAVKPYYGKNGEPIVAPNDPTKTGYTFAGWYSDVMFITAWDFSANNSEDRVLYAKWNKNPIPTPNPTPDPEPLPTIVPTVEPTKAPMPTKTPLPTKEPVQTEEPSKNPDDVITVPSTEDDIIVNPDKPREPNKEVNGEIVDGKVQIPNESVVNTSNGQTDILVGDGKLVINISNHVMIQDMQSFIDSVLTSNQVSEISKGKYIEIRLNVEEVKEIEDNDREIIERLAKENNLTVANYYDIRITVNENDQWVQVVKLQNSIQITLQIPNEVQAENREFYAIRVHEDIASDLRDIDDDLTTVTVETDEFSTYAIAYRLKEMNAGFALAPFVVFGILLLCIGGAIVMIIKKKQQD